MTNDYQLNETKAAKRLAELAVSDDPADLSRELALCRLLLEQAASSGNNGLSATLLGTIARLAKEYDAQQARRSLFLHRDAILRFANDVVRIVNEEFRGADGYENRIDSVVLRLTDSLGSITNTSKEVEDLTGRAR